MKNFSISVLLSILLLTAIACQDDFDPSSLVKEMRILAIKAEPPEFSPGSVVTFTALVANPSDQPLTYKWLVYGDASFLESPGTKEGPAGEPLFEFEGEELIISVEDWEKFSIPFNVLMEMWGLESVYIPVVLIVQGDEVLEEAFKGVLISVNKTDPNRNPKVKGILVDGELHDETSPVMIHPSASGEESDIKLSVKLDDSMNDEGDDFTYYWYSEYGEFEYIDKKENTWTAPDEGESISIIVVVRDGRGGIDWCEIPVEVELIE